MYYHGGNTFDYESIKYDFSSNINPLGLPNSFKEAMMQNLKMFTKYPDIKYRGLIKSIEKYLGISNMQILLGNGAIELVYNIIANSGFERLYTIVPTFCEYKRAALINGMHFCEIPCYSENFLELDIELFLKEIKKKSLIVLCNPNNPTGFFISKEKMIYIAEKLAERDCSLLIDECFIEFTDDYPQNSFVSNLDKYPNVVVVRALTKFYGMPGIRFGYGITSDINLGNSVRKNQYPWNINTAGIIAGCTVLEDEQYIRESENWIRQERGFLFRGLSNIKFLSPIPSKANFHLVKMSRAVGNAYNLRDTLADAGILIRVPEGFSSLTSNYFRLAVLDRESNMALLGMLKSLYGIR